MTEVVRYATRGMLMTSLGAIIAGQLQDALDKNGKASLAVPGGTTPGPLFDVLCNAPIEWKNVAIMLTDERWVPETSERSNTALLRQRLFQGRAVEATMVPFYADFETPEEGLGGLAADVATHCPIDVTLLGMGADMHTASIFPEADNLEAALADDAPTLMAMRAPGAPEPRITLTAPALRASGKIHILLTGEAKMVALDTAREAGPATEAPVRAILDKATVHYAD